MGNRMTSLVILGDTSGSVTLAAPAAAGSTQINIAANSGTLCVGGPAFNAYSNYPSPSYLTFSTTTWTKVQLNAKSFDTNSNYDTSNYRFTPTVAGYYKIDGTVGSNWTGAQWNQWQTAIYKNGSAIASAAIYTNVNNYPNVPVSTFVYLNGSTDYIELYVYSSGGSGPAYQSTQLYTYMTGYWVRGA